MRWLVAALARTLPAREREWGAAACAEAAAIGSRLERARWALGLGAFWLRSWGRVLVGARRTAVVAGLAAVALAVVAVGRHEDVGRAGRAAPIATRPAHTATRATSCHGRRGLTVVAIAPRTGEILWLSPGSPLVFACEVFPRDPGTPHF